MKTIGNFLILAIIAISICSCDKDETSVATTTTTSSTTTSSCCLNATISGVGSLPPGEPGSVLNTRVALYISVDDWNVDRPFDFTSCDGNGNYTIDQVTPGIYYMDAWKDNDNDGIWGSPGDYIWVKGSEVWPNPTLDTIKIPLQITIVNFELFVVP